MNWKLQKSLCLYPYNRPVKYSSHWFSCLCRFYLRRSFTEAALVYWDGEEMSLLWCCISWALCPHPTPEDSQEWETFQVWPVWLLLQTGLCHMEHVTRAQCLSFLFYSWITACLICYPTGTPHDNAQAYTHRGEAICLQPVWENFPAKAAPGHALQALPWSQLCPHCLRLQQV